MEPQPKSLFLRPLFAMFVLAFAAQLGLFFFSFAAFDSWEERGQFGDSFGFINAIFSGFALCGVIYSLAFQLREQARLRREARALFDAELQIKAGMADAMQAQTAELKALREIIASHGLANWSRLTGDKTSA